MKYIDNFNDAIDAVFQALALKEFKKGVAHGRLEERAEHAAQRDGKDALINHLTARVATLEGALTPFATGGVIDSIERKDYSIMRERIVDWHGVSDFRNAQAALTSTAPQSLATVKAAALRELKILGYTDADNNQVLYWSDIKAEADRLEAGENDNARPTD